MRRLKTHYSCTKNVTVSVFPHINFCSAIPSGESEIKWERDRERKVLMKFRCLLSKLLKSTEHHRHSKTITVLKSTNEWTAADHIKKIKHIYICKYEDIF